MKSDSPVVSSPQREHSVEPSPPLASAAPPPPFFSGPSPGRHAGTPGRPRPAAASELVSGSSPPWGRAFELILRLWLFELQAYESETASFLLSDAGDKTSIKMTLIEGVSYLALPFETLRHQVRLVGLHDEVELIDEVLGLNETLQSADHGHLAVFQHDHG